MITLSGFHCNTKISHHGEINKTKYIYYLFTLQVLTWNQEWFFTSQPGFDPIPPKPETLFWHIGWSRPPVFRLHIGHFRKALQLQCQKNKISTNFDKRTQNNRWCYISLFNIKSKFKIKFFVLIFFTSSLIPVLGTFLYSWN